MKIENNLSKFKDIATTLGLFFFFPNRRKDKLETNVSSIVVALLRNGVAIRGINGNKMRLKFSLRVADNA